MIRADAGFYPDQARRHIGKAGLDLGRNKQIAARELQHKVPTIFPYRDFAAAGGLMSYGASIIDAYRPAGIYTGRVLKGEKPADLPVQQATHARTHPPPSSRTLRLLAGLFW